MIGVFRKLAALWLLVMVALPAMAHDIGVMKLRFEELGDNRYQLRYVAPPGSPEAQAVPVLPKRGAWEQEPGVPSGLMRVIFTTVDGEPLRDDERLKLPWQRDGVLVESFWRSGETSRRFFRAGGSGIELRVGDLRAGTGSFAEAAKRYTLLGIEHFLTGWDHVLFLGCLVALVRGWKLLFAALAGFALANGVTLALTAVGRPPLPPALAGCLVALSIAFLAAAVVRQREPGKRVVVTAFAFGLLQGIGLGEAIGGLGLPAADLPVAIGFFTFGVELAQVFFVLPVLAGVWEWRRLRIGNGEKLVQAAAAVTGVVAMFWFFQRAVGLFG